MIDLLLLVIVAVCAVVGFVASLKNREGKSMRRICYVVGAGLTKSLEIDRSYRVPLMTDFVTVLADHIDSNVVLTALTNFEEAQLYDWSRAEWRTMARALDETSTTGERAEYADVLRRRPAENIEKLLNTAVKRRRGSLYASIAEDRFGFAINAVFARVGWNLNLSPLIGYLNRQLSLKNTTHTFISFNYDLVLDYCIQQCARGRWSPASGYGLPFTRSIHVEEAADHMKQFKHQGGGAYSLLDPRSAAVPESEFLLLKPHGSLNWLLRFEGNYDFVDDEPLLITDSNGQIAYCTEYAIEQIRNTRDPHDFAFNTGIFITPPLDGDQTERVPQFLAHIVRQALDAVRDADEVVVIGWSMPATDKAEVRRLQKANAKSDLNRSVTGVNFNADPTYFRQLAEVLHVRPERMRIFNSGFVDFVSAL